MRVWETSPTSKNGRRQTGHFTGTAIRSLCLLRYETVNADFKGKDGKEWNRNEY